MMKSYFEETSFLETCYCIKSMLMFLCTFTDLCRYLRLCVQRLFTCPRCPEIMCNTWMVKFPSQLLARHVSIEAFIIFITAHSPCLLSHGSRKTNPRDTIWLLQKFWRAPAQLLTIPPGQDWSHVVSERQRSKTHMEDFCSHTKTQGKKRSKPR